MDDERYNPAFLNDDEYRREQRRTKEMVQSIAKTTHGTGTLKVNAYAKGAECDVGIEILGIGAFKTPLVRKMDEGTYTVKCSNQTKAAKIRANETTEVVFQLDSQTFSVADSDSNAKNKQQDAGQGSAMECDDLGVFSRLKRHLREQMEKATAEKTYELERFKADIEKVSEGLIYLKCSNAQHFDEGDEVVIIKGESIIKGCSVSEVAKSSLLVTMQSPCELRNGDEVEVSDEEPTIPYKLQLDLLGKIESGEIPRDKEPVKFFLENKPLPELSYEVRLRDIKGVDGKDLVGSQISTVEKALSLKEGELLLIIGPPGTGKTRVIKKIAYELMKAGQKVLIASHTNIAVDNAIDGLPHDSALRVGIPRKVLDERYLLNHRAGEAIRARFKSLRCEIESLRDERKKLLEARENSDSSVHFKDELADISKRIEEKEIERNGLLKEEQKRLVRETPIIGSTLVKSQLRPLNDVKFDVVIIDECSQASITLALLSMIKGKKWILVGDHKQLLPIFRDMDDAKELEELSVFNHLKRKYENRSTWLSEFHRSNPKIIWFPKHCLYSSEKDLIILPKCEEQKLELEKPVGPRAEVLDPDRPVVLINVDGRQDKEGESRYNEREVEVCGDLVSMMVKNGIGAERIGIITPYRAQKNRLAYLRKSGVEVGTVDSFQGREKDVVIFSIAATDKPLESHALSSPNKFNVALTRPRKKLIVIANASAFWKSDKRTLYDKYKPRPLKEEEDEKAKKLFLMFLVYAARERGLYDWKEDCSKSRWLN